MPRCHLSLLNCHWIQPDSRRQNYMLRNFDLLWRHNCTTSGAWAPSGARFAGETSAGGATASSPGQARSAQPGVSGKQTESPGRGGRSLFSKNVCRPQGFLSTTVIATPTPTVGFIRLFTSQKNGCPNFTEMVKHVCSCRSCRPFSPKVAPIRSSPLSQPPSPCHKASRLQWPTPLTLPFQHRWVQRMKWRP